MARMARQADRKGAVVARFNTPTAWSLGKTRDGPKMIHRPTCRHARRPYTWAGECSEQQLIEKIKNAGITAVWSNAGCYFCCNTLRRDLLHIRSITADPFKAACQ